MRPSRLSTNEWLILLMLCSAFFLYLGMAIGGSLLQRALSAEAGSRSSETRPESGFKFHVSSLKSSSHALRP